MHGSNWAKPWKRGGYTMALVHMSRCILVEYINILDVFNIYNPAIRPGNGIL